MVLLVQLQALKLVSLNKNQERKKTILLGSLFSLCTIFLLIIFSCWQAVLIATISLGFGYIFIQSTLATSCLDIATDSKGLPSGIIGLCLFGGAGLGTAFNSWLLSKLNYNTCLLYTSPSPRDLSTSRMPSSA
eukprot:TRINITY_DN19124_c0_g1_i1.p3 TRINITY_DN19124_c0_g1~~TRINITY_DN19124_c0_g1_i1.p3  ORF type:complete len:133 (-),score=1.36 TRINITY_DN19124_c0_g1_i1:128-526(-)